MKSFKIFLIIYILTSCSDKIETTFPEELPITESIYASGYVKSKNQYEVHPKVNGIVEHVYVSPGDQVIVGSPLISIYNETQKINNETAKLTADFYNYNSNVEQLNELKNKIYVAKLKVKSDSIQFTRQLNLKDSGAGTAVDYENAELMYENSKFNYFSAINQYSEFKRQLKYNSKQAKKNVMIAGAAEKNYSVFSEIEGKVYNINIEKGEMVTIQTPIAVIGDQEKFILEMLIDEKDILKTKLGQQIIITLDSYENNTFKAVITKINPIMDIKTRSFLIEAEFEEQPKILYPNLNFQANIIVDSKENAILIPRDYLLNDTMVIAISGDTLNVEVGLKDFKKVEILSGLTINDEIIKP